jgi:hypothetical protein
MQGLLEESGLEDAHFPESQLKNCGGCALSLAWFPHGDVAMHARSLPRSLPRGQHLE